MQFTGGQDEVEDREVGARLAQIGQDARGVADPDGDPDARVAGDEGGHRVHDRERPVGADLEPADPEHAGRGHQLFEVVELGEHAPRAQPEVAAELGKLDPLALPAEQQGAIALLERPDLHRDRGLADPEPGSTTGEAAFGRDRVEGAKVSEVHNRSL